jgi:prepilin-type N-terminal cleavage/methylation domain-containing protein
MKAAAGKHCDGFSLLEVVIALVIFLIGVIGVFSALAWASKFNSGNGRRSQALSVMQQQVELMRSAKFSPYVTDAILLGGVKANTIVTSADGSRFNMAVTVDNDPDTAGVQSTESASVELKEITLVITPEASSAAWELGAPARVVLRRSRSN